MDRKTANEIDKRIQKIIKEMGLREPPLKIDDVVQHLNVHHSYYDLEDPNLLQEIFHRMRIGAKKAIDAAKKVNLKGLWLPETNQILIDLSVKEKKRKWVSAHEISHKIIPAHAQFLQGDTAETLDPEYHEMLEAEANYGASALIFMGDHFTKEALQVKPCFEALRILHKRYQNTLATTLRRIVQYGHNIPMLGVVSTPYWLNPKKKNECRYFIPSNKFFAEFSKIFPQQILDIIEENITPKKGGMIGTYEFQLTDDNGGIHEFLGESFFTSYDVLTLITYKRIAPVT